MHKMAFAHVFGPEKKNGFGPFSYKFFVCIRVGLIRKFLVKKKRFSDHFFSDPLESVGLIAGVQDTYY